MLPGRAVPAAARVQDRRPAGRRCPWTARAGAVPAGGDPGGPAPGGNPHPPRKNKKGPPNFARPNPAILKIFQNAKRLRGAWRDCSLLACPAPMCDGVNQHAAVFNTAGFPMLRFSLLWDSSAAVFDIAKLYPLRFSILRTVTCCGFHYCGTSHAEVFNVVIVGPPRFSLLHQTKNIFQKPIDICIYSC